MSKNVGKVNIKRCSLLSANLACLSIIARKVCFETGCFVDHLNMLGSGNCQSTNTVMSLIKEQNTI